MAGVWEPRHGGVADRPGQEKTLEKRKLLPAVISKSTLPEEGQDDICHPSWEAEGHWQQRLSLQLWNRLRRPRVPLTRDEAEAGQAVAGTQCRGASF